MSSHFNITVNNNYLELRPGDKGEVSLTITNLTKNETIAGVSFTASDNVVKGWIQPDSIDMEVLVGNMTNKTSISIKIPEYVTEGIYTIQPVVYAIENPDEIYTVGPNISIIVLPGKTPVNPPKETVNSTDNEFDIKSKLIIAMTVAGVLILAGGLIFGGYKVFHSNSTSRFEEAFIEALKNPEKSHLVPTREFSSWQYPEEWNAFLQTVYDQTRNSISLENITKLISKKIIGIKEVKPLYFGLYSVTNENDREQSFSADKIKKAIDQAFFRGGQIKILNVQRVDSANKKPYRKDPSIDFQLNKAYLIKRIDLQYESSMLEGEKSGFRVTICNTKKDTNCNNPVHQYDSSESIGNPTSLIIPDVIGDKVVIRRKGLNFMNLSEVRIYGLEQIPTEGTHVRLILDKISNQGDTIGGKVTPDKTISTWWQANLEKRNTPVLLTMTTDNRPPTPIEGNLSLFTETEGENFKENSQQRVFELTRINQSAFGLTLLNPVKADKVKIKYNSEIFKNPDNIMAWKIPGSDYERKAKNNGTLPCVSSICPAPKNENKKHWRFKWKQNMKMKDINMSYHLKRDLNDSDFVYVAGPVVSSCSEQIAILRLDTIGRNKQKYPERYGKTVEIVDCDGVIQALDKIEIYGDWNGDDDQIQEVNAVEEEQKIECPEICG